MRTHPLTIPLLLLGTATNVALLARAGSNGAPVPATPETRASDRELALGVSRAIEEVAGRVTPAVVSVTSRALRGSGVILDDEGLVATNHHVTRGSTRVRVTLFDGRELSARVIGSDPETDLAVLDLPGDGYASAPLSTEEPPTIGTWVLAIGNPMGLDHTVTFGIISARGRAGVGIALYEDFLQTDAAINSGNSGGPMVNLDGDVVGINTAKEVNFTGNQGLGFAIPAYMVREVVDQIVEKGYVERGWFGISTRDLLVGPSSVGEEKRVRVETVIEDSPAEAAGIRAGDIVLTIAGGDVNDTREVFDAVADLRPGSRVPVEVWRDSRVRTLYVVVGEREPPQTAAGERP